MIGEATGILEIDIIGLPYRHRIIMGENILIKFLKNQVVAIFHQIMFRTDDVGRLLAVFERLFPDLIDDVAAESIDSSVEPKAEERFDFFQDFGVVSIQVRLLLAEDVQIPSAGFWHVGPSAAAKIRGPVIRR